MDLALALVCDDARERADGRLDLIGVFTELGAPGFPAVQPGMTVVFILDWAEDEIGTQAFRADLLEESGRPVFTIEGETEVSARAGGRFPPRTQIIMPLEQVVFPHAGRYRFQIVAGGDVHHACSVFVGELKEQ
jgi:hypothetical protein